MVIFEDLHWIEKTQALLNLFVDSIGTAKLLVLVNYRPEYPHAWGNKTYYTQLRLDPLGREGAEEMLTATFGDGTEVRPLKRLIIERTQGIPSSWKRLCRRCSKKAAHARNGAVMVKPLNAIEGPATCKRS